MRPLLALLLFALPSFAQLERAEAAWRAQRWQEANDAFRQAIQSDSKNPSIRVRWGQLLQERFNPDDAAGLFAEALELDPQNVPAHLALAQLQADAFDRRALDTVNKTLDLSPQNQDALELKAHLLVEDSKFSEAAEVAKKLQNPQTVQTIIDLLHDRPVQPPTAAKSLLRIARHLFLQRRYEEAIAYDRLAAASDPTLFAAQSDLGINLMRVGQDTEARQWLEKAYQAGYRNAATANSLRLLDSYKNFVTVRKPRFVLRLHKSEAALLGPYVEREVARALDSYDQLFQIQLHGPVTVELYPDHEDFAVRTMGMPGLGALGVTFGLSIAMDSPSGRTPGSFHWAATLWHELAHVYTLTATRHRVPRWFTEGISVHCESIPSAEWADRLSPDILSAISKKELLPVATLDQGFIRPKNPTQIGVSYFQGGRILDFITQRYGWPKVLALLQTFSKLTATDQAIENVLGVPASRFDQDFISWLEAAHKTPLANYKKWPEAMKAITTALKAKDWETILKDAPQRIAEYPDYVEAGTPYKALADAHQARSNAKAELDTLQAYAHHGGRDPELLKRLSALHEAAGNLPEATKALERVLWIYPLKDEALHRRLAGLLARSNNHARAIEEWQAVVATGTTDPASAHLGRAVAFKSLNRLDDARDAVLTALEAAPGFRPAQRLLLELQPKEERP